jgi:hypothetical protein
MPRLKLHKNTTDFVSARMLTLCAVMTQCTVQRVLVILRVVFDLYHIFFIARDGGSEIKIFSSLQRRRPFLRTRTHVCVALLQLFAQQWHKQ